MGFETRPYLFLSASPLTSCLLWARYLTSVSLNFITSKNEDVEVIMGINESACKVLDVVPGIWEVKHNGVSGTEDVQTKSVTWCCCDGLVSRPE